MSALTSICALLLPGKGRRRAARPPAADQCIAMLRPVEALVTDEAYCPAERRQTMHAFLALGGRVCMDCRTLTTAATPPGGVE
jgi:hypothetical protein